DGSSVSLTVRDDGRGFDVSSAVAQRHEADSFGLHAMRERVEQLDGALTITSPRGGGSTVTARLPLSAGSEMEA
ncbi:MAG: ATP-binding protein, partial [Pseudoclavibacter sp.]